MKKSSCIRVALLVLVATNSSMYALPFGKFFGGIRNKVSSWFYQQEEVIKKEITHPSQKTILVENSNGDIYVKTWHQDGIALKVIKHAYSLEDLAKIAISIDTKNKDVISIKTKVPNTITHYAVDYQLLVPQKIALRLSTEEGNIRVKRCNGAIYANTDEGTVEVLQSTEKVCAVINGKGTISVKQAKGTVQATIEQGNIILNDTENSVLANASNGSITMICNKIRPTASIRLNASGTIELQVPENTNAHVQASSEHGKIVSDHYINLEPRITKLNDEAWHMLKQNVEGTIGTGEAEIILHADSGIKILEAVA